jgi:putative endonuclease
MTPRVLLERILRSILPERQRRYGGLRGVGQRWERFAERHLRSEGYEIRDRNFRATAGEIDFIAEEKGVLCFIEVKGRRTTAFGEPADAVTVDKQARIFRAAEEYLRRKRIGSVPCRFDVVSILESEGTTKIAILRDAFQGPVSRRTRR